ncbi:MAG: hypothetical protein ISS72_03350 [Candidatus Brocadiae bacterium]|nr:hypothetical protein [Candidatus Brocadiia bacterium]
MPFVNDVCLADDGPDRWGERCRRAELPEAARDDLPVAGCGEPLSDDLASAIAPRRLFDRLIADLRKTHLN